MTTDNKILLPFKITFRKADGKLSSWTRFYQDAETALTDTQVALNREFNNTATAISSVLDIEFAKSRGIEIEIVKD